MGEVYAAEDPRLRRRIALKLLPDGAAEKDPVDRLVREAQAAAALQHPGIVTIHSVEEADNRRFMTMELIDGQPLSALIPPGGLEAGEALRIGGAIAAAIGAAHARGVIHRDLKPANVMVAADGTIKVLDFGLARWQHTSIDESSTWADSGWCGALVGTVAYMSPEQAEGKPLDHRTDIFSLGVMLYEMVSGRRPFGGDTPLAVLSAILKDTFRPVSEIKPEVSPAIPRIIGRCLEKDPARRYQRAEDLAADLEHVRGEHGAACSAARDGGGTKRRRSRAVLAASFALGLLGAVAGMWWAAGSWRDADVTAAHIARLTTDGSASVAALSPDGRHVVHVRRIDGRESLWMRQTGTESRVQIVPPGDVHYAGAAFSADGNDVYYVTYPVRGEWGTLFRVSALGGEPSRVLHDIDSGVAIAPGGERLAFIRFVLAPGRSRAQLLTARTDGSDVRALAEQSLDEPFVSVQPSWSADGRRLLAAARLPGGRGAVVAIDANSGEVHHVPGDWAIIAGLAWLHDGRSFLVSATKGLGQPAQVWQVDAHDGTASPVTKDLMHYGGLSVSRDGRTVAAVQVEATSNVFLLRAPLHDARPVRLTTGRAADGIAGLCWLPDGRVVLSTLRAGSTGLHVADSNGAELRALAPGIAPAGAPTATSTGELIFHRFDRAGWRIWRSSTAGLDPRPLSAGPLDLNPVLSRDGRWVYFHSLAGGLPRARRISLLGGAAVPVGTDPFTPFDTLPDGRLLGIATLPDGSGQLSSVVVIATAEGTIAQRLPQVPFVPGAIVTTSLGPRVTPDGRAVAFVDIESGHANVWTTPIDGGSARRLTNFEDEEIFSFAFSPGGDLAVAKGRLESDVITLTLSGTAVPGTRSNN